MDEALKAKLAFEQRQPKRKRQLMPQESKWAKLKKWFVIHPKVQAAFYATTLVIAIEGQSAFDGAESWQNAAHRVGDAVFVLAVAYLKKSNGSTV